ncbi:MAG: FAD-binding oxidoreductase [Firmicutes bacterium]|nr:FAD-binding oxidoreductase [Bacillota bacterium]
MSAEIYDAIIVGAGSVGTPTAMKLAEGGLKVLVLEKNPSAGQGQNKAAIGGIRATFSDPGKIEICRRSLEIVSTWNEKYGDDLGWQRGGYCFPVYTEELENKLKDLLVIQRKHGLNIDWIDAEAMKEMIPGVNPENLRGGTFSPDDGNVSPLRTLNAFYKRAVKLGVEFRFNEEVTGFTVNSGRITEVKTAQGVYSAGTVVIASGADAKETGEMLGLSIPVTPDTHEAGITEPVESFFSPLVVDLRERPGSANFYFYQNYEHQIVFCLTPNPPIWGKDRRSTSGYLPMVARRLIELVPRLKNVRVRRVWRGLYPMTPDGIPIVDKVREIEGLYLAVGLCGQGLMLGPGIAENLSSLIIDGKPVVDREILGEFTFYRNYNAAVEMLK